MSRGRRGETEEPDGIGGEADSFRILFVCTGNTCRSPLAEAVTRRALRERGWPGVEVSSAGTSTLTGLPASEGAREAAEARGLDLSAHGSRQLTRGRVEAADLVLGMTPSHVAAARGLGGGDKTVLLGAFAAGDEAAETGGRSVPDPFGGDRAVYLETLDSLERMVRRVLDRLEPLIAP